MRVSSVLLYHCIFCCSTRWFVCSQCSLLLGYSFWRLVFACICFIAQRKYPIIPFLRICLTVSECIDNKLANHVQLQSVVFASRASTYPCFVPHHAQCFIVCWAHFSGLGYDFLADCDLTAYGCSHRPVFNFSLLKAKAISSFRTCRWVAVTIIVHTKRLHRSNDVAYQRFLNVTSGLQTRPTLMCDANHFASAVMTTVFLFSTWSFVSETPHLVLLKSFRLLCVDVFTWSAGSSDWVGLCKKYWRETWVKECPDSTWVVGI